MQKMSVLAVVIGLSVACVGGAQQAAPAAEPGAAGAPRQLVNLEFFE